MHVYRNSLVLLVLLTLLSNAEAAIIAQTTANSLNVRATPNGKILFTLPQKSIVGIMETQGSWALIIYLPNGSPQAIKQGWVSTSYLQIIKTVTNNISGDNCEYEYDSNTQVCISATNADIDCHKAYDGSYYRSCVLN